MVLHAMLVKWGDIVEMESVQMLKERLEKSQNVTDTMLGILGSFDRKLSCLHVAMQPTQVQTDETRRAHENIENALKAAEEVLAHYDTYHQVETKIMEGPHGDLSAFVSAVDKLQQTLDFFISTAKSKNKESTIHDIRQLLSKATRELEQEFKQLLAANSKVVEPEQLSGSLSRTNNHSTVSRKSSAGLNSMFHPSFKSNGSRSKIVDIAPAVIQTLVPVKVVPKLYEIAKNMINTGHSQECTEIYREIRSSSLNQTLQKLGVEKYSNEDIQKLSWELFEQKIGIWIQCLYIVVKILYTIEWRICNQIFYQLDPFRESCFSEITETSMKWLLSFGEATVKSKRVPEKLFVFLDMYDAMSDLLPEVRLIFGAKASTEALSTFEELTKRLGQAACNTLSEYKDGLEKDATKMIINDGTVHPLTSYVINYTKFLFEYRTTLECLIKEDDKNDDLPSRVRTILSILLNNLDGKAKQYKDLALMHFFLMNNIHCMVSSIRNSEVKEFLGDDWVQRHRRLVKQHANSYLRAAWSKALHHVSSQGLLATGTAGFTDSSNVSNSILRDRFKYFNQCFEELYQRQVHWTIPDTELRESLTLSIAEVLLPAYRSFLKRFSTQIQNVKNTHKYIKYTPDALEEKLGEFFKGVPRRVQKH